MDLWSFADRIEPAIVEVCGGYRYADFQAQSMELMRKYPQLCRRSIGRSVLGRSIDCFIIGNGSEHLHMNGAVHANEWITTPLLLRFMEELLEHAGSQRSEAIARLLERATLWIVPMVNPDGVDLAQDGAAMADDSWRSCLLAWNEGSDDFTAWKANIRGVDLNDQFPACWETERERRQVCGPASQDYSGPCPLSEPEAQALAELTETVEFSRVLSLHTQGREIYWNYRNQEPPEAEVLAEKLAAASGYRAVKLSGSDAGYKDWFIMQFCRPGYTVEAGEGKNPLPPEQFDSIYKDLAPLLFEFIRG
ncbi:peptidase M14 [Paenibacillus sp. 79R4]|uniref:M14 family metallopeptidase n=1 Tax=Paenibacillus sp. 79R4 TaxID=2212847 RepID=UPI0015BACD93|nr:M14 family metallocarboxypeptidase [Paenibacillus sp. 79R4]NWL89855.1 peptidase M14 [Paenibacillus sp. 79R4]